MTIRIAKLSSIAALLASVALAAIVSQVLQQGTVAQADHDQSARALELVAAREGVPLADLEIMNSAKGSYREQGITLDTFKVYDHVRHKLHVVSLDARGQEVDPEETARRDRELARQKRGALDAAFATVIDAAAPTDEFDVVVVVLAPGVPLPAPTGTNVTQDQIEAFLKAATDKRRREVAVAIAPVVDWLDAKGVRVNALTDSAFLYGRMSVAVIRELSRRSEIVAIERQARLGP